MLIESNFKKIQLKYYYLINNNNNNNNIQKNVN
jgi:hypothetical protein